ncbi:SDR family NAD(P)-dependent oxidoreductase [Shimia sp.]|uniref:SDR family NAD(P)-dependent oxidoreductase n=1 Tax=Shimia sp. TaxID=1954381 RepID=UPI003B8E9668
MNVASDRRAPRTAVISGGAGGLGTALSQHLQRLGWRVVVLDRDLRGLQRSDMQIPITCDLTDAAALADVCAQVVAESPSIDLVIYNAGLTSVCAVPELTDTAHRHLFEVNYFAATAMAQAFLAPLRASQGTHLAVTSVAGFAPLRQRAAYAASKHAMTGFFGSLRAEEAPHGVDVCIAAPSFVATNPDGKADHQGLSPPGAAKDAIDAMSAEQAAAVILRGFECKRAFIPVGRVAKLSSMVMRLSPAFYQWLMARVVSAS